MHTDLTIDSAGRVLLPSAARKLLNLRPGSRLRLEIIAERIELTPAPDHEDEMGVSPTGRPVLKSSGKATDAAAAVNAERENQALLRPHE